MVRKVPGHLSVTPYCLLKTIRTDPSCSLVVTLSTLKSRSSTGTVKGMDVLALTAADKCTARSFLFHRLTTVIRYASHRATSCCFLYTRHNESRSVYKMQKSAVRLVFPLTSVLLNLLGKEVS